jgi:hypothetical protein
MNSASRHRYHLHQQGHPAVSAAVGPGSSCLLPPLYTIGQIGSTGVPQPARSPVIRGKDERRDDAIAGV